MQVIIKDKKILQILRKFLTDTATKTAITTAERSILDSISVNLLTAQKSMVRINDSYLLSAVY